MDAIKFDLCGKNAHFKNPENNINIEVSYDNIPKTALVGSLGAILGLRGRQHERELGYLEYLEELKGIKVSIIPHKPRWRKYIDEMNNSTGFANIGGNQIIRKQILEDVRWTIFIQKEGIKEEYWNTLSKMLEERTSNFPIFLGKKEYKARISDFEIVNIEKINDIEKIEKCDSLAIRKLINEVEKIKAKNHYLKSSNLFLREDYLPVGFNKIGLYTLEKFIFTNSYLDIKNGEFYECGKLILNFF